MSEREMGRVEVLARVKSRQLRVKDAAQLLGVSYRQAKRLWRRYRRQGAAGLKHGHAGRASNGGKPAKLRQWVLQLIREKYGGVPGQRFGPTLAAEHLKAEDRVVVDHETLRRWMLAEGLWSRARKRPRYRPRRARREHFGELVQLHGSMHDWLEGRGPQGCLMVMVDDATNTLLCQLHEQETTWAAASILRAWIERYGVPAALYTDWKNVYVRQPTAREQLRGEQPRTAFGRMCHKLGIAIIAASSPQAKGRVERNNGTLQDRLIKKMRLLEIDSHAGANAYFGTYLVGHNQRFAVRPARPEDYHRRAPSARQLDQVFRIESERVVSNDWVVRYDHRFFQIHPQGHGYVPAHSRVRVCTWEDGRVALEYRGQKLPWTELAGPPERVPAPAPVRPPAVKWVPPADHPWRKPFVLSRAGSGRAALVGIPASAPP